MTKKNIVSLALQLEKISQSSSPDPKKGINSPLRTCKARVYMGGFSDTYRSFFKRENEQQISGPKGGTHKVPSSQSLAEKQQIIQDLQQKIMKQTVKKNAREKSYSERIKTNWRTKIEQIIKQLIRTCIYITRGNNQVKKSVLDLLFRCYKKSNRVQRLKLIMHWICLWLRPIFAMIGWVCRQNIA